MFAVNKKSIGIDIADHSIEIAEASKGGGAVRVLSLGRVVLAPGVIVNGRIKDREKLEKAFRMLFDSAKPRPIKAVSIYLGLPERQVFSHGFEFEPKNKSEDEAIINNETRTNIPIESANLIYSYGIVKIKSINAENKEVIKNKVTVVAADRETIAEWEEFFKKFKIEILGFDIESYAVYRGLFKKDPSYPVCIVDIGSSTTNIFIYSNGALCYSHTINKAGEMFTKNIAEIRKSADGATIGMVDAEGLKIETGLLKTGQYKDEIYLVLSNALRSIQAEIKIALDYYKEKADKNVMKIILVGGSSRMKGILDYFSMNMQTPSAPVVQVSDEVVADAEKEKFVIEIGKSAYIDSPAALQYIEAVGIAVRGVEKNKYKNIPLLVLKNSEKKAGLLDRLKKTKVEKNEKAIKENTVEEVKIAWIKTHPKEFQLLIILFLGIVTIAWAFWYRAHNSGSAAKSPVFENASFDFMQEKSKIFPIAANPSEYTADRVKGRVVIDTLDKATALSTAIAQSKEKISVEKKRGEVLWSEPLNKPKTDASIVFPLKLEWLFFSEADLKNLYTQDIKKEYSDEFLFDKLEYLQLEATENKNVYNMSSKFNYLTTKDISKENFDGKTATTSQAVSEEKKESKKTEPIATNDEKQSTSSADLTLEELQQALKSAKGPKQEGYVTILKTSVGWLNARSGPGTNNPVISKLSAGDSYKLLEEQNNWIKLDIGNDLEGWVLADYVEK
jgi:Tfp pilus assembly PilM family ATPase